MIEILLKEKISSVIKSLNYYEKGFSSTKRTPVGDRERSESLSQFIECRFNFELFKVNEFKRYEEIMDGHLFKVSSIEGEEGRKFQYVNIEIGSKPDYLTEIEYSKLYNEVSDILTGDSLRFNNSWKKTKLEITSNFNNYEEEI